MSIFPLQGSSFGVPTRTQTLGSHRLSSIGFSSDLGQAKSLSILEPPPPWVPILRLFMQMQRTEVSDKCRALFCLWDKAICPQHLLCKGTICPQQTLEHHQMIEEQTLRAGGVKHSHTSALHSHRRSSSVGQPGASQQGVE